MRQYARFTTQALEHRDQLRDAKAEKVNVMFVNGVYRCSVHKHQRPPRGYNWDRGVRTVSDHKLYTATEKKEGVS